MPLPFPSPTLASLRPLGPDELHVWHGPLAFTDALRDSAASLLPPEEQARATRFLVPEARDHFLAARALLRQLLASYCLIPARDILLTLGPQGKPALSPAHESLIRFNISHSHGMGLFVFALSHDVGADLEKIRPNFGGMEIAGRFFSPQETAQLAKFSRAEQSAAFFRCWTRKEAYIKARGAGMSIPLQSFSVDFSDTRAQQIPDESGALWSCFDVQLPRDFAGAVVAAGEGWRVCRFEWTLSEAPFYREIRD